MSNAGPAIPTRSAEPAAADRDEAARRSFLRMVSHELRTPLNSILGFSEILSSELYGPLGAPQYKEYAEIIRGSGHKLLKLVNQVLEIARLEAGVADFDLAAEPIEAALDEALAGLRDELVARDVRVSVAGRGTLGSAVADARGLRTVLASLLQNAIAASPEGGEVRVEVRRAKAETEICIADDGDGVDPAELPRLLAPFEVGESALTRRGRGPGLGLPVAELTCRMMGGGLALDTRPGQGFTARVRLPAA